MFRKISQRWLLSGVAAAALLVGSGALPGTVASAAEGKGTQTQTQTGPNAGAGGNSDQAGEGGKGAMGGGIGSAAEEESDGKGPKAGQPAGDSGGKPIWAQEGIPEVELGRLSVIRSPDRVLDHALDEAVNNFDPALTSIYEMSVLQFDVYITAHWDDPDFAIIDSPLENLALLKELWTLQTTSLPVDLTQTNIIELSAIFIGVASDKAIPVSVDTIIALARITGVDMSLATAQAIADKADDVREAVAAAHDA